MSIPISSSCSSLCDQLRRWTELHEVYWLLDIDCTNKNKNLSWMQKSYWFHSATTRFGLLMCTIGGGGFCLFGCRQIHKLDREQGRAQNEHAHQKKHGFFSPFSSSILQKQQQHQYNARAWNEQKRESMDSSSSSSFIIILHMQQQQNAKSVKWVRENRSSFFSSSQATTTSKCKELGMTTLRENPMGSSSSLLLHMQQQQKCMIT